MASKSKRLLAWLLTAMMAVVFIPCMSFASTADPAEGVDEPVVTDDVAIDDENSSEDSEEAETSEKDVAAKLLADGTKFNDGDIIMYHYDGDEPMLLNEDTRGDCDYLLTFDEQTGDEDTTGDSVYLGVVDGQGEIKSLESYNTDNITFSADWDIDHDDFNVADDGLSCDILIGAHETGDFEIAVTPKETAQGSESALSYDPIYLHVVIDEDEYAHEIDEDEDAHETGLRLYEKITDEDGTFYEDIEYYSDEKAYLLYTDLGKDYTVVVGEYKYVDGKWTFKENTGAQYKWEPSNSKKVAAKYSTTKGKSQYAKLTPKDVSNWWDKNFLVEVKIKSGTKYTKKYKLYLDCYYDKDAFGPIDVDEASDIIASSTVTELPIGLTMSASIPQKGYGVFHYKAKTAGLVEMWSEDNPDLRACLYKYDNDTGTYQLIDYTSDTDSMSMQALTAAGEQYYLIVNYMNPYKTGTFKVKVGKDNNNAIFNYRISEVNEDDEVNSWKIWWDEGNDTTNKQYSTGFSRSEKSVEFLYNDATDGGKAIAIPLFDGSGVPTGACGEDEDASISVVGESSNIYRLTIEKEYNGKDYTYKLVFCVEDEDVAPLEMYYGFDGWEERGTISPADFLEGNNKITVPYEYDCAEFNFELGTTNGHVGFLTDPLDAESEIIWSDEDPWLEDSYYLDEILDDQGEGALTFYTCTDANWDEDNLEPAEEGTVTEYTVNLNLGSGLRLLRLNMNFYGGDWETEDDVPWSYWFLYGEDFEENSEGDFEATVDLPNWMKTATSHIELEDYEFSGNAETDVDLYEAIDGFDCTNDGSVTFTATDDWGDSRDYKINFKHTAGESADLDFGTYDLKVGKKWTKFEEEVEFNDAEGTSSDPITAIVTVPTPTKTKSTRYEIQVCASDFGLMNYKGNISDVQWFEKTITSATLKDNTLVPYNFSVTSADGTTATKYYQIYVATTGYNNLSKATVTGVPTSVNYNGSDITFNNIQVYYKVNKKKVYLKEGVDYEVVYPDDMTNAGKKTLTIKSIPNSGFKGSKNINYTINKISQTPTVTPPEATTLYVGGPDVTIQTDNWNEVPSKLGYKLNNKYKYVTCTSDANSVTVHPNKAGKVTVTVTAPATTNYKAISKVKAYTFTVKNPTKITSKSVKIGAIRWNGGEEPDVASAVSVTGAQAGTYDVEATYDGSADQYSIGHDVNVKVYAGDHYQTKGEYSVQALRIAPAVPVITVTNAPAKLKVKQQSDVLDFQIGPQTAVNEGIQVDGAKIKSSNAKVAKVVPVLENDVVIGYAIKGVAAGTATITVPSKANYNPEDGSTHYTAGKTTFKVKIVK